MARTIALYVPALPADEWESIADFVRAAVTECNLKTPYAARDLFGPLARHVHWCVFRAVLPLSREVLFRRDVISLFASTGCADLTDTTRGSYRSRLFRMAEILLPGSMPIRVEPLPPSGPAAPYSQSDVRVMVNWARHQNTDHRIQNALVLLGLGLGAGLSAAEIIHLRSRDVLVDDDGVLLQVSANRPRLVPVTAVWEEVLAEAAERVHRDRFLFRPGREVVTKNVISNFTAKTVDTYIRPSTQRLRVTWIVGHLEARVPINALVTASGVDSLEALTRYLHFVPQVDPDEVRRSLRREMAGDA